MSVYTLFKFESIHTKISIMARGMSSYSMSSGYFNGYSSDYEEKLLNTVWMGIVGLEVLMVLGVALRGISRRLSPHLKLRSQWEHNIQPRYHNGTHTYFVHLASQRELQPPTSDSSTQYYKNPRSHSLSKQFFGFLKKSRRCSIARASEHGGFFSSKNISCNGTAFSVAYHFFVSFFSKISWATSFFLFVFSAMYEEKASEFKWQSMDLNDRARRDELRNLLDRWWAYEWYLYFPFFT